MYLKSLELSGFKSFANKTHLAFEPGMTAIVGPNGCGKSNVSDAVRWVLGEQSPKALRGSKMEDCIFNGTDAHKPLNMAEVNITFADCEQALGTEYHEVTVSRRVFRSGEGQYFINKTPCRLKDIQRLFMDTGIGTTSYSLMEQGRIDQVLSSRPEDRRTIFEEASGITKFKADKKEAIRKLEHTETNLLRLADVIREVKRQIGSLQRQAGKARRYKEIREDLRKLDIYATKERIKGIDRDIRDLDAEISAANDRLHATRNEINELEEGNKVLRKTILETERQAGAILKRGVEISTELAHTRELIEVNKQRIEEYGRLSERDTREIDQTKEQIRLLQNDSRTLSDRLDAAIMEHTAAEEKLLSAEKVFSDYQKELESARKRLRNLQAESVELESRDSHLNNELLQIETRERSETINRERLLAERTQLERVAKTFDARQAEMQDSLEELRQHVEQSAARLKATEERQRGIQAKSSEITGTIADLHTQISATETRVDMLRRAGDGPKEQYPAANAIVLDPKGPVQVDRNKILGALSDRLEAKPEYAECLQAVLRSWLDAVIVSDVDAALQVLNELQRLQPGPVRLLALPRSGDIGSADRERTQGARLLDHVAFPEELRTLAVSLLGNVFVVDSLSSMPVSIPEHIVYATRDGSVVARGCNSFEFRTPGTGDTTLADIEKQLTRLQSDMAEQKSALKQCDEEEAAIQQDVDKAHSELDGDRYSLALKEGEYQIVSAEAAQARERLDTVTWEINNLGSDGSARKETRQSIAAEIERVRDEKERLNRSVHAATETLHDLEGRHAELQADLTRHGIEAARLGQEVEHLRTRNQTAEERLNELQSLMNSRSDGIVSYEESIGKFKDAIRKAEEKVTSLSAAVETNDAESHSLQKNRDKQSRELEGLEETLASKRRLMDQFLKAKSELDLKLNENNMRRQNLLDRSGSEYGLAVEQIMNEPEPEWPDTKPEMDFLETQIAELRTKLEAMGPVNLVAIEEHRELEERYAFLTQQEEDLVNSKQQLLDMIRKINRTTSDMFRTTFAQVNKNFENMFKKLFNGGSAKLVLVNEEDVLECGIEIIAKPPGKRLQNISLLSGGERTLTAVSLLFAIYMIKPSPFCLLDELDAALDESNIGRFVNVLKEFLGQSQFVVITHNRQTIAASSVLYGVTMPEKGVSRIVSMKFSEAVKA